MIKTGATKYFPDQTHHVWDNSLEPVLSIRSGDTVVYHFKDVGDGQIGPTSDVTDLKRFDFKRLYPLSGPLYIEEAEPGDTLEVEIVDLHTRGWGWTAIIPGEGLLKDHFTEHYLKVFDLSNGSYIPFNDRIQIPLQPFLGAMGVAPAQSGEHPVIPPGVHGGNMDIRHLTKGARLFLPVHVKGALFSAGDGHAAQGDGEICITAVEAPLYGALRFTVHKGKRLSGPQFMTPPGSLTPNTDSKGFYCTTGIGPDLKQCAQDAALAMIQYLQEEHGLSREDAYILCSITVDLKISEIVDEPNYIVSAYLPLSIFS